MSCSIVRERYKVVPMLANSTYKFSDQSIGGFLATVAGTLTVTTYKGVVVVDAVPVAAGAFIKIPAYLDPNGGSVTLAGGAKGTLFL